MVVNINNVSFTDEIGTMAYISVGSNIDPTKPEEGNATTQSVRDNFAYAKYEMEAVQAAVQKLGVDFQAFDRDYVSTLPAGDTMLGPLTLVTDATQGRHAVTKEYVDNLSFNGGGGGVPEAPDDGKVYGRKDKGWVEVTAVAGSVKWEDIQNMPIPITNLAGDSTATPPKASMVSGGNY